MEPVPGPPRLAQGEVVQVQAVGGGAAVGAGGELRPELRSGVRSWSGAVWVRLEAVASSSRLWCCCWEVSGRAPAGVRVRK
ncbi:hypothetical protein [Streptomyces sp. NBC_00258]|uniref:hypothetical protein n=1 Tax=Streptomyces sp. NBC_00258 TaxID=2903642 RepID=UPI002E2BFC6A|nr:hypothetical protein [Streptomyces sp. NBC_00258]